MYIEGVPNCSSPPAILLRESYREGGKVNKRTLANLSHWPRSRIEALRAVLRGAPAGCPPADAFDVVRSRPHKHIAAVLGTAGPLGLGSLIARRPSREREIIVALIVAGVLDPRSKLATVGGLRQDTLTSSLGSLLGLERIDEDEVYAAMEWLLPRQSRIEGGLARRHLKSGTLVLYDLTSTWFEERH